MGEKVDKIQNVPRNVPRLVVLSVHKKNYSAVKLFIPKDEIAGKIFGK